MILRYFVKKKYRLVIRRILNNFRGFYYLGSKFYCICCNRSFREFLPFGNIKRANAKCPKCESLERTRLLQFYLKNETDIYFEDRAILHFAPEYMLSRRLKESSKKYISVDIEKDLADRVEDIQNLSFKDMTFDYVICSCVLGHVSDETKAIDEIYRVLKIGGKAFILTVIDLNRLDTYEDKNIITDSNRLKFYGEKDLLRLHGRDFINRLKRTNGIVREIDYAQSFSDDDKKRYSLGNKERELIFEIERIG
ncbi:class I SAM-dependent methyltransferase [Pedobacter glucosidilyticus]|uniref:class I SAM-dependent methyltransferase n=1 Tax=Pedobacter glucosidilyticus TaxID=1122941 RepID=UPI001FE00FDF|nr:class I SAM-dependent methyltransferase [Pedobacter glucosidilyticus]